MSPSQRAAAIAILAVTLPLAVIAWPLCVASSFIPVFGFLVLPTLLTCTSFILYGTSWLLYLVLAPAAPLPYSPIRCYALDKQVYYRLREALRLGLPSIAVDWVYRRVMVLGSKEKESIVQENIPYDAAAGKTKYLDVYLPFRNRSKSASAKEPDIGSDEERSQMNVPVVVFVPGGGWAFADKRHYLQIALNLRKKGLMVVVPDLTPYPNGSIRDMVSDLRKVLAWTAKSASHYGGNPDSIHVMAYGSGAHISLLTLVQDAVVKSRDAFWLRSSISKLQASRTLPESVMWEGGPGDADDDDNTTNDDESDAVADSSAPAESGEIEISAGIRRLAVWGGEHLELPPIRGLILLAGVSDVIKHVRLEHKTGIEDISPLRRALGPSHADCLLASPSHLLFGAKQILNTDYLPANILLIHGGADRDIPIVQTVLLKTLLQGVGVRNVVLKAYRDLSHMECMTALTGARRSRYSGMIASEIVGSIVNAEKDV